MRILVVDDSSPHRRMLTAIFGHAGHQVLTASDGEAALALLERESVNAVVSDVRMPKLDGFQLCRAIRRDARWARSCRGWITSARRSPSAPTRRWRQRSWRC